MKTKTKAILKGIILANGFALMLLFVSKLLYIYHILFSGLFVASDFILIPIVMGIINVYCWRPFRFSTGKKMLCLFYNLLVLLFLCAFFMKEGVFCLIIVFPLLLAFLMVGQLIGEFLLRRKNKNLNISILGLLLVLFAIDINSDHQYVKLVSDEMIIQATPDKIWRHVVAFETIQEKSTFWMFRLGMPQPMRTTVSAYYEGADRKCIFNDSIVFDEKMTVFQPQKNLTFDILKQPQNPEIIGHIETQRGQFLLKDNKDGTTTLIGNSWYKLNVFPAWYYDLWAESIVRNVHLRVMKHIKKLSERKAIKTV